VVSSRGKRAVKWSCAADKAAIQIRLRRGDPLGRPRLNRAPTHQAIMSQDLFFASDSQRSLMLSRMEK
jgi:hypothetical protein